jgi:hypothetical protein
LGASTAIAADGEHAARDADLRCVVLARGMSASGEESMKAASALASYYFIGRLEGREPDLDLEAAIADTTEAMQSMDVRPEATRCGDQLVNRASELRAIDMGLQRRAQRKPS